MATETPVLPNAVSHLPTCPNCRDVSETGEYAMRTEDGHLLIVCPTCGREFRSTDRLSVFRELFDVIARHRRGVHSDRMASELLQYEGDARELLGLSNDATRAIFLDPERRTVVVVGFDKHGIRERVEEMEASMNTSVCSWLYSHRDDFQWVHPQYEPGSESRHD